MSASAQFTTTLDPVSVAQEPLDADDSWQPVAATAHVGTRQSSDSFLTILPDDSQGTPRGARRQTWRR